MVCGMTWYARMRLGKMQQDEESQGAARSLYDRVVKKMRMELGAFDYQAKEQGELLTRYLCDLDNILSFGNAEVKETRKALVVFIQSLLTTADTLNVKGAKLKEFGEQMIARLPEPEVVVVVEPEATEVASSNPSQPNEQEHTANEANEEDTSMPHEAESGEDAHMKPLLATEDEEEQDDEADDDKEMTDDNEEVDEDDENEDEKEEEDDNQTEPEVRRLPEADIDLRSLPVWRPYYQIQKRHDGVYLVANLRGIDRDDFRVQWNEDAGVLRISGVKRPTQKDIMMSRFSGVPTFGRFEIAERFPANALNMDEASQVLGEDGTLEIRMPYSQVLHPSRVLRRSFDPFAMPVW
uniref:SHSP domain-containing protein n=1 Tax=Globisporangium ultimum (strain ATCC 200006 / CBS 805.95 / DAOM BR144) TaxID=431595 RepID=K3WWE2_GLOUD